MRLGSFTTSRAQLMQPAAISAASQPLPHTRESREASSSQLPRAVTISPSHRSLRSPSPQRSRPLAQPRRASVHSHTNTLTRCTAHSSTHIATLPTLKSQRPYVPVHSTITTASAPCTFYSVTLLPTLSQHQHRHVRIFSFSTASDATAVNLTILTFCLWSNIL